MKKILTVIFVAILLLIGFLIFQTLTFNSKQIAVEPIDKKSIPEGAIERFSQALQIPTISYENSADFDSTAFSNFKAFIKSGFPLIDSLLEIEYINEYSMIITWAGKNKSLPPAMVLGHLDVVPVLEENLNKWKHPPFAGKIVQDTLWGRGAIDDKISVMGNLEATEWLLSEGYQPERTLMLCFGHDEELGGVYGAQAIVAHLQTKEIKPSFILDEGFAISQGLIPGIEKNVALIGTAEKGFLTLNLSVSIEGGHSSMPKKETAIDVLSRAIVKLKENPFPAEITPPVKDFMNYTGPEMAFGQKLAFANAGILESVIISTLEAAPSGNALVRTTTSPTIIKAGVKDNVIPYEAKATVNFRTLPGTTTEDVINRVQSVIDDERIIITKGAFESEAPGSSSTASEGYKIIEKTVRELFPDVLVTPNLVVGATDSRHYYPICKDIYRFTPFYLNNSNITTFHGVNERLPVAEYENAIRFYARLLENASQ